MTCPGNIDFRWLVCKFTEIIDILVMAIFALALVVVIWQILNAWIIHGGDAGKVKEGKKTILVSFLVLIVMASIWGIIALLRSSII